MGTNGIDERRLGVLSDTVIYVEATQFLKSFPEEYDLPPNQQLIGLLTFSRNWGELVKFVKHQKDRDWGNKDAYKQFYTRLWCYLDDAKTGLRTRVKKDLGLIPVDLDKKQERELRDLWAGALAREFVQHLVAAALYHSQGRRF